MSSDETRDPTDKTHPDYDPRDDESLEWTTIRYDRKQVDGVWCVYNKMNAANGPCSNLGVMSKEGSGILVAMIHFSTDISLEEKTAVIHECTRRSAIVVPVGDKKHNIAIHGLTMPDILKHHYCLPAKDFRGFMCDMFYDEELDTIFGWFDHMAPLVINDGDRIEMALVYLATEGPVGANLIAANVFVTPAVADEEEKKPVQKSFNGFMESETTLRS